MLILVERPAKSGALFNEEELISDLIGEYVFTDEAFVKNLSAKQPNIFQKIYNHIKHLIKMASAGSKEAKQLEQIKNTFDKAYKEMGKASEADSNLTTEADSDTEKVKYSLMQFEDGKRFVEIDGDTSQFDGLSKREQGALATKIIKEKYGNKVIGVDNRVYVNGRGAGEYGFPVKELGAEEHDAKMRASTELDNIIDAGFNFRNEPDGRDGHIHEDVIDGFDYFDAIFKIGDKYFQGTINIKNIEKGKLFKDLTKIKDVTEDISSSYGKNPKSTFLRTSSMDIIPDISKDGNTKKQYSLSVERPAKSGALFNISQSY